MSYNTDRHLQNPSVKIGSISFFSSFNTQKFHLLLILHLYFFKFFACFNLICQAKSLLIIIVSGSSSSKLLSRLIFFKIYVENTHFITIKYNIIRIFIKIGYIFMCIQSSKKLFNHFPCNKPIRKKLENDQQLHPTFLSYIFITAV